MVTPRAGASTLVRTGVLALALLLSGCGGADERLGVASPRQSQTAGSPASDSVLHPAAARPLTTIRHLVEASEVVVVGTVGRVELMPPSLDPDSGTSTTMRVLHVTVGEVLHGPAAAGDVLAVRDFGFVTDPGQPERVMRSSQQVRLEEGDEAVLFLAAATVPHRYDLVDGSGSYRLQGQEVEDDRRERPSALTRQIQAMDRAQLRRGVREARP